MRISTRVHGADRIGAKLDAAARAASDHNVVIDALWAGGEVIAKEARARVPVRSGNLRASIEVGTEAKRFNFSSAEMSEGEEAAVYVGPVQGRREPHDGFYGHMVEFGTMKMAAQPFMRPALSAAEDEARRVVGEKLGKRIEGAARG